MKPILILLSTLVLAAFSTAAENNSVRERLAEYAVVRLTTDIAKLSEKEKAMIPILIEVAGIMDSIFWLESFGDRETLLRNIKDESVMKYAMFNYGPWDRLDNNRVFIPGFKEKFAGNNFYPRDLTNVEFDRLANTDKTSRYTVIKRNSGGLLNVCWFHDVFRVDVERAAALLAKASALAENSGLKNYLKLRAEGLLTDNYGPGDAAWMNMKESNIDFIVGPSEVADELYDIKTAHEAVLMVKDHGWSRKAAGYMVRLPRLQKDLPVGDEFKKQGEGSASDLSVCDAIYCAGDANCGSKTVAICLPSDANLRKQIGSRRFLLKNVIKAKFDNILVPLADALVDSSQKEHVRFEAFFENLMFLILSEIAQGPGVQQTINGKGSVRESLGEAAIAFEEAKASILSVFFAVKIVEAGNNQADLRIGDIFVTYMVNILRSIRRGIENPAGKANMMSFNYFMEKGAFQRNSDSGRYKVDVEKAKMAMNSWIKIIIEIQGNGNKAAALDLLKTKGSMAPVLRADLDRLKSVNIPKDVIYEQGLDVLGLGDPK